jgi:PAS domain S-box-containing protein
MNKRLVDKIKILWPYFLGGIVLLAIIVLVVPQFSWIHFILFILTVSLGFLVGNLNTPGARFRERKLKKQSRDLAKLNDQMRIQTAAMESAANGIIITDTKGIMQWVNPGFTRLTGYNKEESVGSSLNILKSGHHSEEFYNKMWKTIIAGGVWHDEIVNKRKDGSLYTE